MSRHWMPMFWPDFTADTGHLSAAETGAYLMLIGHYWVNKSLPNDDKKLARIARMTLKEWVEAKATISEFFQDGWRHKRIEEELEKAEEKSKSARASAEKRWQSKSNAEPMRTHMRTHSEGICETDANDMLPHIHIQQTKVCRARKRATRLTEDWILPSTDREWAKAKGMSDGEIDQQANRMARWSISSTNGLKLDWSATWRNWCEGYIEKRITASPPAPARSAAFTFSKPPANF